MAAPPIPWGERDTFSMKVARSDGQPDRALSVFVTRPEAPVLTPGFIKAYLRERGINEDLHIHKQDYKQFIREKGLRELGRGGEGAVYFLRGHVVKMVSTDFAFAALREISHMLHLNPTSGKGGALGERSRYDWPALLWIYTLSNGGLSIGMKPFDLSENYTGSTLYDRLAYGPTMDREHMLRSLKLICKSLVYSQKKGIIHHDLKPANIYIPGDREQDPVVFDLGQALWRRNVWGPQWLKHNHNNSYWYNGTYRYMYLTRRLAHLAALAAVSRMQQTDRQRSALRKYQPSHYDDVFAIAYIIRDVVRSPHVSLHDKDRYALRDFYRKLMGFKFRDKLTDSSIKPGFFARMTGIFKRDKKGPAPRVVPVEHRYETLEIVTPKLEELIATLV